MKIGYHAWKKTALNWVVVFTIAKETMVVELIAMGTSGRDSRNAHVKYFKRLNCSHFLNELPMNNNI